jgi:hypothetical protein
VLLCVYTNNVVKKRGGMDVKRIDKATAKSVIEAKHYSKRLGIMWEAFGLYVDGKLCGVCCYGQPSAPIQKHAFAERDFRLYELTRMVVDRGVNKNAPSYLIAQSLKMLNEQPSAVVSYADSKHGHCGIVYQASNWLYTGATVAHDSLYMVEGVPMHAMSVMDKFRVSDPGRWAKENGIERVKPGKKHRYFFLNGSKRQKRKMLGGLKYPVIAEYPKTDKTLYEDGKSCHSYIAEAQEDLFL